MEASACIQSAKILNLYEHSKKIDSITHSVQPVGFRFRFAASLSL
jgi:hypothetical protein